MPTLGIGVITRNRRDCCLDVVAAIDRHTTADFDLVVGVDHSDDNTTEALRDREVTVVEPAARGVPANRNAVLAELADHDIVAIFEDDHLPIADGWQDRYIRAVTNTPTQVALALNDAHGPVMIEHSGVVWRPNMTCQLIVVTQRVLRVVGGWNPAFGDFYGCDDGEYLARCIRAGLTGGPRAYPSISDPLSWSAGIPDPPSSDGKSVAQRAEDAEHNMPLLVAAMRGSAIRIPIPARPAS